MYQYAHSVRRSQRFCFKSPLKGQEAVLGKRDRRAAVANVITCGGADCPWCGPRWSEQKGAQLSLGITNHCFNDGMVVMVTYTLRHGRRDRLDDLWKVLGGAFTYATNGHVATRRLYQSTCLGFVIRKEVTHGGNGWHPHLHVAYFVRPGKTMRDLDQLVAQQTVDLESYFARHAPANWNAYSRKHGVSVSEPITRQALASVGEHVARYMAKDAARELSATATKRGRVMGNRTSMQLLVDAAAGDDHAARLYTTFERAMMGKRRMRWSKGLAELVLPEELAQAVGEADEDQQIRSIARLPYDLWHALRYRRWQGGIGITDLMDAVEDLDDDCEAFNQVAWLCGQHGLPDPLRPDRLAGNHRLPDLRPSDCPAQSAAHRAGVASGGRVV